MRFVHFAFEKCGRKCYAFIVLQCTANPRRNWIAWIMLVHEQTLTESKWKLSTWTCPTNSFLPMHELKEEWKSKEPGPRLKDQARPRKKTVLLSLLLGSVLRLHFVTADLQQWCCAMTRFYKSNIIFSPVIVILKLKRLYTVFYFISMHFIFMHLFLYKNLQKLNKEAFGIPELAVNWEMVLSQMSSKVMHIYCAAL